MNKLVTALPFSLFLAAGSLFAQAPASDNFAGAAVIDVYSNSVSADTSTATAEIGEPSHYTSVPHHSLWWAFTPARNGTLDIDTQGSAFDTVLALYSGSSLTNLLKLASNDSAGDDAMASRIVYPLTAGITYRIALDGYSDSDNGTACLNWAFNHSDITLSAAVVNLQQPPGTAVGTFGTVYTLGGDTFAYALVPGEGDTDNGRFSVSNGTLRIQSGITNAVSGSCTVRVRSTDQIGLWLEKAFTITLLPLPAVTTLDADAASFTGATLHASASANGDHSDALFQYALSPALAGCVTVLAQSGVTGTNAVQVSRAITGLQPSTTYYCRAVLTNGYGAIYGQILSFSTLADVAPTNITLTPSSVAEIQPPGVAVGTLSATDADAGDTFTYALVAGTGGTDNGAFSVSNSTLWTQSSFTNAVKSSYAVRIRATDRAGLTFEKALTVTVLPAVVTLAADALTFTGVMLHASVNPGGVRSDALFLYSLLPGLGGGVTALAQGGVTGSVTVQVGLSVTGLLSGTTYYYRAVLTNGYGAAYGSILSFSTLAYTAPTNITLSNASVAEIQAPGTVVGTFSSADADAGDSFTYALVAGTGGTDNGAFSVSNGTLRTQSSFTNAVKSSYSVRVRSTDKGGMWLEKAFTVTVLPAVVTLAADTLTFTGATLRASANPNGIRSDALFQCSLLPGLGGGVTALAQGGVTGSVTVQVGLAVTGLLPGTNYYYRAALTNGFGAAYGSTLNFSTLAYTAPTNITLFPASVAEIQPPGTVVGVFSAADADAGDSFTYALVAGTGSDDNGAFSVSNGTLRTQLSFAYVMKSSYSVRVRATDLGGMWYEKVFTVSVLQAAATQAADTLTFAGATLRASVNPNGVLSAALFQYSLASNLVEVTTLAGAGSAGFTDGASAAAEFNAPRGMAVDGAGNVYVGDTGNNRIRKVTPGGSVSTLAGSVTPGFADGTNTAAQFNLPRGVAVDGAGNVYVADYSNNRIRKVSPAGTVSTLAGSGTAGFADGTNTAAQFSSPYGVTVDGAGNVYVADFGNSRIRKVTPAGSVSTLAGSGSPGFADGTNTAAQFNAPYSVAVDGAGYVYVADCNNSRIRKITPAGAVSTLAGSGTAGFADGTNTEAQLNNPKGVVADGAGNVYVGDSGNNRIRKVTPTGTVSTLAGSGLAGFTNGTASQASFNAPYGVGVDGAGNVYVADAYNNRIRKISQPLGILAQGGLTGASAVPVGLAVTGLLPGTTYYYRAVLTNASGTAYGPILSFSTRVYTAPTDIALSPAAVAEKQPAGTAVGTLSATDADAGDSFTYALVSGTGSTDNGAFSVSNGTLLALASFTNAVKSSYSVRLRATDLGGMWYEEAFTVAVLGAPTATTQAADTLTVAGATLRASVNPNGVLSAALFQYSLASNLVEVTTLAGSGSVGSSNGPASQATFSGPRGVALDGEGNLYVADQGNHRIRKITPGGVVSTLAGSIPGFLDGTGSDAKFNSPYGVTVDGIGAVYVADFSNNRIRKVTPDGVVSTLAGSGSSGVADGVGTNATFGSPSGVAMDESGNVYVTEYVNHRIRKVTSAGAVTTLAGSSQGYLDGTNSAAQFSLPRAVDLDGAGNLYVADYGNQRIRKITPAGLVSTLAGSGSVGSADGTNTAAAFSSPRGVAVDNSGNIYVADSSNNRIRKITPAGAVTTLAGSGNATFLNGYCLEAGFNNPYGVAVDSAGNLYVGDQNNNRIRKIGPPPGVLAQGGLTGSSAVPVGLAVTGLLPGTNYYYRVVLTNASGSIYGPILSFSTCSYTAPTDIALSPASVAEIQPPGTVVGTLSATDADAGDSLTYALVSGTGSDDNGAFSVSNGTLRTQFSFTYSVKNSYSVRVRATDLGGLWYEEAFTVTVLQAAATQAADTLTFAGATLRASVNPNGILSAALFQYSLASNLLEVTTLAGSGSVGSSNGPASQATFSGPRGVAVDGAGNLYVADTGNNRIRKITPDGTVSTLAGSTLGFQDGTNTAAQFSGPWGLTVDGAGNVYVADTGNNRIRKVTPSGAATTLAGSATPGVADGIGTNAAFASPSGVAADGTGNVYVTEYINNRVRKVTPAGVVTTLAGSTQGYQDGTNSAAQFNLPRGVAVDGSGSLYVADYYNNRIRKVTPSGAVSTLAGSSASGSADGTNTAAMFNNPRGVAVDSAGNVYVADSLNNCIRKISPSGTVTTLAGSGSATFLDGSSFEASFNNPYGVAVDAAGTVYVADQNNNRIRKLAPPPGVLAQGGLTGASAVPVGLAITGLLPGTTYYCRVVLTNASGAAYGPILSFSTRSYTAPTDIALSPASVAEIQPPGTVVGTFSATDADAGDSFTYALVPGTGSDDNGAFSVSNGTLRTQSSFTNAVKSSYSVRVRATDLGGLWYEEAFTVTVLPAADTQAADTLTFSGAALHASVNPNGVRSDALFQYSLLPGLGGSVTALAQGGVTGSVTVQVGLSVTGLLSGTTYYCRAALTNAYGAAYGPILSFTTRAYTAPTDIALSPATVAEIQPPGTVVGTLSATDADAGDSFTYALVSGTGSDDNASFSVSNGTLRTLSSFTNAVKSSYSVRVRATDLGGQWYEEALTVTVLQAATTQAADTLTFTGATLRASVNPNGVLSAALFQYSLASNLVEVTTLAGSGVPTFAEGTGAAAAFNYPCGVAVDGSGNVVVADQNNSRIRKITASGASSTLAGAIQGFQDGTNTGARFYVPRGLAVDGSGTVYVADCFNNRIRKITPSGAVSTLAGSGTATFADGTGTNAAFSSPWGVALDAAGNVYVADFGNNRIRKITPSGVVSTLAGSTYGYQEGTNTAAQFRGPYGVALDAAENVYVADAGNSRIRKITPSGAVSTLAGSTSGYQDGLGASAQFYAPHDVALDIAGNVYVADYGNHRIRKVSPSGAVSTLSGTGGAGFTNGPVELAAFNTPQKVAVDSAGSVYVADQYNHRIRKISPPAAVLAQGGLTGVSAVPVGLAITGLQPGTTYYYRAVLTNTTGAAYGPILSFTTRAYTAPTDIALSSATVAEIQPPGTVVGTFSAADADAGDSFTYALVSGTGSTDNGSFSVSNGTLRTQSSFTNAVKSSYSVRVRATDLGGLGYEKAFTVTVLPAVVTLAADTLTFSGATLRASANPGGVRSDALFQYSLVPGLGGGVTVLAQGGVTGLVTVQVGLSVTGLLSGTTYYYRAALTNRFGAAYGQILNFTTADAPIYTVTLTAPLAAGYPTSMQATAGAPYGALPTPAVFGYTFGGWWSGVGGTGVQVTAATIVAEGADRALYARLTPKTSRVTLDPRWFGVGATQQVANVTFGAAWPAITVPAPSGYAFGGWFTPDGQQVNLSSPVTFEADQTLLAQWVANSESGTASGNDAFALASALAVWSGTANTDTSAATAELGEPAHYAAGPHHSLWWAFTPDRNGTFVVDTQGSAFDTVLALYSGSSLTNLLKLASNDSAGDDVMDSRIACVLAAGSTYHIALDGYADSDSGAACLNWAFTPEATNVCTVTLAAPLAAGYPSNILVTVGAPYGSLPSPAVFGYVFGGWWTGVAGTGLRITNATTVTLTTNHTLTAWLTPKTSRVTFDPAWPGATQQVSFVTFGAAWPARPAPVRTGFVFEGWFTSGGVQADLSVPVAIEADQTLLAWWSVDESSLVPPVNDAFASAALIDATSGVATVDTVMATAEAGEPAHYAAGPHHSLWWAFTPATNGTLVVDTQGSAFDTVLALYSGSSLTNLLKLASNDSAGDDLMTSRIEFPLAAGTACRIALDGYADSDCGAAVLNWSFNPAAADMRVVTLAAPLAAGYPSNVLVTVGAQYGAMPSPAVFGYTFGGWWTGVAGTGLRVTNATTVTLTTNHTLNAWFSPKTSSVTFDPAWPGATQQVSVVTFGAAWPSRPAPVRAGYIFSGWFTADSVQVDLSAPVSFMSDQTLLAWWVAEGNGTTPPVNDAFVCAAVVTATSGVATADTGLATAEPGEPAHYAAGPHHSLWWAFTPAKNGTLAVDTQGSAFDTVLALYSGANLTNLQQLASNDSAGDDAMASRIAYPLAAGVAYRIALDGYADSDSGAARLSWAFTPLATNISVVTLTAPLVAGYPSNILVTNGASYGALPEPTAFGYTFGGWWRGVGGTGLRVTNATVVATGANHALFAKFTPKVSRVTFDANGSGATQQVVNVTFGAAWPMVATPALDAYDFAGWFTAGGVQTDLGLPVACDADQTLYARWIVNPAWPVVINAWPSASLMLFGQPLSSSRLTGGSASVPGSFSFASPATIPDVGAYRAAVTFTPLDTVSYPTVLGTVTVTVRLKQVGTMIRINAR